MADYAFSSGEASYERNDTLTVGTANVVVSRSRTQEQKQERKTIIIRNISDDPTKIISLNFGVSAVANTGIVLRQFESFTDTTDAGYKAFQGQINAICAVAGGTLAIFER